MRNHGEYKTLTRERFLFREMRIVAKLLNSEKTPTEIKAVAEKENIFEFPTTTMSKNIASLCIRRLNSLGSDELVDAVANKAPDTAKMVCLYAMMKQNWTVCDFMLSVVGEKYRTMDLSFSRADINIYFMRLQEQNDTVASWSSASIKKSEASIEQILLETEYLESRKSTKLAPVWLPTFLKNAMIENGDGYMLPAFNSFDEE